MTPEEMRAHIEVAPLPNTPGATRPWEEGNLDHGYDLAGRGLAHAFLVLCEEDPSLLEVPSKDDDPTGSERASNDKLWKAFKARWPDGNEWLGGCTGFQFGWAHNAVRYVLGVEAVGNPAIVTVGSKGER
jgi:hypothetical protein